MIEKQNRLFVFWEKEKNKTILIDHQKERVTSVSLKLEPHIKA